MSNQYEVSHGRRWSVKVAERNPTPDSSRHEYCSVKDLKSRGWTERLVQKYLPVPDCTVENPHLRSAAPKRLYLLSRVLTIETESESFRADKARSESYSGRLQVQSDAKRLHLESLVRGIVLPALTIPWADLQRAARQFRFSNPANLNRSESELAVEVLIGTMKSLDWHLDEFMYHSGIREARKLLRRRMLAHIIDNYPELADAAKSRAAMEDGNTDGW
jgi:hypothetical protein